MRKDPSVTNTDFQLATWNVRGVNNDVKAKEILGEIVNARLDVCGMTETKWKGTCVREWECGMGVCAGVNENARAKEGVYIYVSNKWKANVREYGSVGSRIVWVRMKVGVQTWVIVCVYAPTEDKKDEVKVEFWTSVEACLDGFNKSERMFLT